MPKVLPFERRSLRGMIEYLEKEGPSMAGTISISMKPDGKAHFEISGFENSTLFEVLGLIDWVKADLISDLVN